MSFDLACNLTKDALAGELISAGLVPDGDSLEGFRVNGNGDPVGHQALAALRGWSFQRAWRYWICSGPALAQADCRKLVGAARAEGYAGSGKPVGPAGCGLFHVDDSVGLRSLADAIRGMP